MDDKLMELIRELFKAVMSARQDIADLKAEIELLKNPPKKPRGRKKKKDADDVPSLRGEDLAPASILASIPASDSPSDIAAAPEHASVPAAVPIPERVPESTVAPEPASDLTVTLPSQSDEAALKSDASELIARANALLAKGLQL